MTFKLWSHVLPLSLNPVWGSFLSLPSRPASKTPQTASDLVTSSSEPLKVTFGGLLTTGPLLSLFIIIELSLCQEPVFSTIVSYLMTRAASYACLYRAPPPPHVPTTGQEANSECVLCTCL